MHRYLITLLFALTASAQTKAVSDATVTGYLDISAGSVRLPESVFASLPAAAGATGKVYIVTDAAVAGSCSAGSGSARSICRSTGSAWESIGGAIARVLLLGPTAICQSGVTPGLAGSTGAANAPTATCEADGLSAYVSFAYNTGTGQTMYQRIDLPQDWAGTAKLNIAFWSATADQATLTVGVLCVKQTAATTGGTFTDRAGITLTPNASSYRTTVVNQSLATPIATQSCAAGDSMTLRYTIVPASGKTINLRSIQVTE